MNAVQINPQLQPSRALARTRTGLGAAFALPGCSTFTAYVTGKGSGQPVVDEASGGPVGFKQAGAPVQQGVGVWLVTASYSGPDTTFPTSFDDTLGGQMRPWTVQHVTFTPSLIHTVWDAAKKQCVTAPTACPAGQVLWNGQCIARGNIGGKIVIGGGGKVGVNAFAFTQGQSYRWLISAPNALPEPYASATPASFQSMLDAKGAGNWHVVGVSRPSGGVLHVDVDRCGPSIHVQSPVTETIGGVTVTTKYLDLQQAATSCPATSSSSKTLYYVAGGVVLVAAGGAAWWKYGRKKKR